MKKKVLDEEKNNFKEKSFLEFFDATPNFSKQKIQIDKIICFKKKSIENGFHEEIQNEEIIISY